MSKGSKAFLRAASLALLVSASGCVWIFRSVDVEEVQPTSEPVVVESPIRVHFQSGRNAVFAQGALVDHDFITARGEGQARVYNLDLTLLASVQRVSMDSVVAVETYDQVYDVTRSAVVSVLATTGVALAIPTLMVAVFGSCPTVYSMQRGEAVLDAESFPNSIVSLFEQRDVDPVRAQAQVDGFVELEIRNEALETHYINHLELLEVQHSAAHVALPAPDGLAYLLGNLQAPTRATDRSGRDVRHVLRGADEAIFSTDPARLAAADPNDLADYIDLTFPAPPGDSAAVVLRLRNSLLNTIYFYDFMLAGQGARSLDWLGRDLESITYAVGLGDFYAQYMGLRVQVWDGTDYQEVGKVGEVGPIAWNRVAVPVPVTSTDSLHIRLHFIADAWRIDEVTLAAEVRTTTPRRVPLESVVSSGTLGSSDPLTVASEADEQYLVTMPGTRFHARFDVGEDPETGKRTFFIAAQGYYTEWIRRGWLESSDESTFTPSRVSLHAAMQRWQEVMPAFERRFETSKIPVR